MASLAGLSLAIAAHAAAQMPVQSAVDEGRVVYGKYCGSCHGAKGQGAPNWQERNAQGDLPAPPHNASGHTWRHSDAMLYRMISKGLRDPFNKTTGLTMPPFQEVLSREQIQDVIAYIKTLWTPQERRFQANETAAPDPQ